MANNIFTSQSPHLDLHGETTATLYYIVTDYINDNVKLGNKYIAVIHGWNSTILKKALYPILKQNKYVIRFYLDINNIGQTIIELDTK